MFNTIKSLFKKKEVAEPIKRVVKRKRRKSIKFLYKGKIHLGYIYKKTVLKKWNSDLLEIDVVKINGSKCKPFKKWLNSTVIQYC
jgi:hypothetical protein